MRLLAVADNADVAMVSFATLIISLVTRREMFSLPHIWDSLPDCDGQRPGRAARTNGDSGRPSHKHVYSQASDVETTG